MHSILHSPPPPPRFLELLFRSPLLQWKLLPPSCKYKFSIQPNAGCPLCKYFGKAELKPNSNSLLFEYILTR